MQNQKPLIFKTARRYDIPDHAHFLTFSCDHRLPLLTNDKWRSWLAESIKKACCTLNIALWAYVFMPEHVHLLIWPRQEDYSISAFLKGAKQPVAVRALNQLKRESSSLLQELAVEKSGRATHRFWRAGGGYDLNIWSMKKVAEKALYCHRNQSFAVW
jgi:putative transposase